MSSFILIHIPHSSMYIPPEYRDLFCLSDDDLDAELGRMTDLFADRLFDMSYDRIVFPVSRLLCDPERFRDDRDEIMSGRGMGAVYTRTSDGRPLKAVTPEQREGILRRFYDPHHRCLTEAVDRKLARFGRCLIIDAHSFPDKPLPYELDQAPDRPDICIGADDFHTPPALLDYCVSFLRGRGYSVAVNRPFSGTLVPAAHFRKDARVMSVMLEINRRAYLNTH